MGTDRTPTSGHVAALVLPVRYTVAGPTESDPVPGRDDYTSGRARLVLSGTPAYVDAAGDTQVPTSIEARAMPTGASTPAGAWVWRRDGADPWYGADIPSLLTRYDQVSDESPDTATGVSCAVLSTGSLLVAWSNGATVRTRRRDGVAWSETEVDVWALDSVTSPTSGAPTTLVELDDGSVLLFTIQSPSTDRWELAVLRSTDSGDTWVVHALGALSWTTTAPRVFRAVVTPGGLICLWATVGLTTSSRVSSWTSVDATVWTQVDSSVGTTEAGLIVWDARVIRGVTYLLVEWGGGAAGADTAVAYVTATDPTTTALVSASFVEVIEQTSGTEAWISGGAIAEDPASSSIYVLTYGPAMAVTDVGRARLYSPTSGGSGHQAQGQVAWWRGSLCSLATRREVATIGGDVTEVRLGGQADTSWSRDIVWGVDSQPAGWSAIDDGLDDVWARTDSGGTPTQTYSRTTGMRLVTDGATTSTYAPTYGSAKRWINLVVHVKVTSGTMRLLVDVSDGTNTCGVTVDVTSTQIRAYDSAGAASSYVSHGAAGYITIEVACRRTEAETAARMYWRADDLYPRTVTNSILVSGLTTSAATTTRSAVRFLPSSDGYVLWTWAASGNSRPRYTLPSQSQPWNVAGIPLVVGSPRYFADGMLAQVTGAPVYVDEVTHTIDVTGARPIESVDPYTASAPRDVWRGPGDVTQTFTLTPTLAGSNDAYISPVWVVYLAGLHNVPRVTVQGGGIAPVLMDLRTALVYQGSGQTIRPASTGSTITGRIVGVNELVGSQFRLANGTVRNIVANTGGSLTSGSSVAEVRAILTLDGSVDTSGTGYIWPSEVAIATVEVTIADPSDRRTDWTVSIASTEAADSLGYREVGTIAVGPAMLLGIGPDRTQAREWSPGSDEVELPDGRRYVVDRRPMGQRVEWSWVASPHDVYGQVGPGSSSTGSPDYITSARAGAPAGQFEAVEMVASAIGSHGRHPVVLCYLPGASADWTTDGGGGYYCTIGPVPWRQGCHYVTIQGDPRLEQVPTQTADAMMRLATLAGRRVV